MILSSSSVRSVPVVVTMPPFPTQAPEERTILPACGDGTPRWSLESWEAWHCCNRYAPMGPGSQMPYMTPGIIYSILN
ncbi:MAG: hypothetical protein JWQ98_3081 [Chlorobi bacterium]|nr:hypothetical protein [Chlorobiota bacterium]